MIRHRSGQRTALVLAGLCVALGALIWAEMAGDPASAPSALTRGGETTPPAPIADSATFVMPPQSAFAEVVERPLFSTTRRPPAVAGTDAAIRSDFRLVGIIASSEERVALIQRGKEVDRVAEGDALGAWTVESIQRDRVILQAPDRRIELPVNDLERSASRPPRAGPTNLSSVPRAGGPE